MAPAAAEAVPLAVAAVAMTETVAAAVQEEEDLEGLPGNTTVIAIKAINPTD